MQSVLQQIQDAQQSESDSASLFLRYEKYMGEVASVHTFQKTIPHTLM